MPGRDQSDSRPSTSGPRRRFVELLLGSGFLATAAAFVYPVFRYMIPPKASDLGSDSVVAGHGRGIEAEYWQDISLWQSSRPADPHRQRRVPRDVGHLHSPLMHSAVSARICMKYGVPATTACTT